MVRSASCFGVVKVGYRKIVLLHGHVTSEVYQDAISVVLPFVKRHGMLAAGRGDLPHVKIDAGAQVDEGYSHPHTKARDFIGPQLSGEQLVDWGHRSGESNANHIER